MKRNLIPLAPFAHPQLAALPGLAPALLRCMRKWPSSQAFMEPCAQALLSLCAVPVTDCRVPLEDLCAAPTDTAAALLSALSSDEQLKPQMTNHNLLSLLVVLMHGVGDQDAHRIAAMCVAAPIALQAAVDPMLLYAVPLAPEAAAAGDALFLSVAGMGTGFLARVADLARADDAPPTRRLRRRLG